MGETRSKLSPLNAPVLLFVRSCSALVVQNSLPSTGTAKPFSTKVVFTDFEISVPVALKLFNPPPPNASAQSSPTPIPTPVTKSQPSFLLDTVKAKKDL